MIGTRRRHLTASATAVLIGASLAVALNARQTRQEQQPQPTFRTGVDYVRVDVVVTDSADRPVTGRAVPFSVR